MTPSEISTLSYSIFFTFFSFSIMFGLLGFVFGAILSIFRD